MSSNNLLTTIAWQVGGKVQYALEGSIFIDGVVVQWLRDGLDIIRHSREVEELARSVPDSDGVYLVPAAFAGLGAPHWNPHARGAMFGTTSTHLARAALDSIAYQTMDVLKAMQADAGIDITQLRVDGGATGNDWLMQFQSYIVGLEVIRPQVTETTALGRPTWPVWQWASGPIRKPCAANGGRTPASHLPCRRSGWRNWCTTGSARSGPPRLGRMRAEPPRQGLEEIDQGAERFTPTPAACPTAADSVTYNSEPSRVLTQCTPSNL